MKRFSDDTLSEREDIYIRIKELTPEAKESITRIVHDSGFEHYKEALTKEYNNCKISNLNILFLLIRILASVNRVDNFEIRRLNNLFKGNLIIKKSKKGYIIDYNKYYQKIYFETYSSTINPKFRSEFLNYKQYGKCESQVGIIQNDKVNVVTGININIFNDLKYHHVWHETCKDGKDIVIDTTFNLIIDKKVYYDLNNSEIISTLPSNKAVSLLKQARKENPKKYIPNSELLLQPKLFEKVYLKN